MNKETDTLGRIIADAETYNGHPLNDLLIAFYTEHCEQARQHENLRAQAANLIFIIATAIIALLADEGVQQDDLALTLLLVPIGLFGVVLINSHHRKNRWHTKTALLIRSLYEKNENRGNLITTRLNQLSGALLKRQKNNEIHSKAQKSSKVSSRIIKWYK